MLLNCISSSLKIDDKTCHIGIPLDIELFSHPIPAYFNATDGYIHQRGNLLGGNIQAEICAQPKFLGCKVGIYCFQPVQKIFMNLIKCRLKDFPLLVVIDILVDFNDKAGNLVVQ